MLATAERLPTNEMSPPPRNISVPAIVADPTPLAIVQAALASGNVEIYREAVALAKEMDAFAARKAFDLAMANAKAEIPVIRKNRNVGFDSRKVGASRTDYDHEDMAEIAMTVAPILSRHGLSYRYRVASNVNEPVKVTCVVAHRDGHFEETTLTAGRDDTGNKNTIQQIGSTITYLQRYTLKAALGLAAGRDDDGRGSTHREEAPQSKPGTINAVQVAEINARLDRHRLAPRAFLHWADVKRVEDIEAANFDLCIAGIEKAAGARA